MDVDNTPEEIDAYHRTLIDSYGQAWPGIGYHFVVRQGGTAYYCGDIATKRANVFGLNRQVIGVVLTGNFNEHIPNDAQIDGAKRVIAFIGEQLAHSLPILGHKEVALAESPTACPGNTFDEWKDRLIGG